MPEWLAIDKGSVVHFLHYSFSANLVGVGGSPKDLGSFGSPMTEKNRPSSEEQTAQESRQSTKKPYQKPEFRFERVFETMALACAKFPGGGGQCRGGRRKNS